jgi:hypothetical protein
MGWVCVWKAARDAGPVDTRSLIDRGRNTTAKHGDDVTFSMGGRGTFDSVRVCVCNAVRAAPFWEVGAYRAAGRTGNDKKRNATTSFASYAFSAAVSTVWVRDDEVDQL